MHEANVTVNSNQEDTLSCNSQIHPRVYDLLHLEIKCKLQSKAEWVIS